MTSDGLADPEAWVNAFVAIIALKKEGKDAELCTRARRLLEPLDPKAQDYTHPLIASLETVASEGFWASYRLERFDDAFWFATVADNVAERIPDYTYGRARTLNNLALACLERAELAKADTLFRHALTLVDVGDDIRGLRDLILSNLSALSGMRGDAATPGLHPRVDSARPLLQDELSEWAIRNNRALEALQEGKAGDAIAEFRALLVTPTLDVVTKATLLSNLGSAQQKLGDLEGAKRTLLEARTVCDEAHYAGQVLAGILYVLGEVYASTGERENSLAAFKAAWDAIRVVAPRSRTSLLILRSLGRTRFAQGDHQRARSCFERGLVIYDEMRDDVATAEHEHEGLFTVCRTISELLIWLSVHEERRFETLQLMQQAKARYWSARLRRLAKRTERDEASMVFEEDDVRSVVGLNGVLIEFFVGPNATFVFLAYNRWFQAYRVDISEHELSAIVDQLRSRLEAGLRGVELAARLSHVLLDKARFDWKTMRLVLIAPDGPLWRIPVDVLPAPRTSSKSETIGALAPVAFIPSASLIRQMQTREESTGPPVFVAVHGEASQAPTLAGAEREIESIRVILQGRVAQVMVGGNEGVVATPDNVVRHLPSGTYIHIAAHAFADEHSGEAYVLLTNGRGLDQRLTASQIEALDLSARMVTLAARG